MSVKEEEIADENDEGKDKDKKLNFASSLDANIPKQCEKYDHKETVLTGVALGSQEGEKTKCEKSLGGKSQGSFNIRRDSSL